jgi:hypothetical protein
MRERRGSGASNVCLCAGSSSISAFRLGRKGLVSMQGCPLLEQEASCQSLYLQGCMNDGARTGPRV